MNMTVLYICFGIIFGILIIALIILGVSHVVVYKKRKEFDESRKDISGPKPEEFQAEDITIRIRNAEVEAFETPAESISDEEIEEEGFAQTELSETEEGTEGILINRSAKMTFEEKFSMLSDESRGYLDEFAAYFTSKQDCNKQLRTSALTFRYKKAQVVRATIRRDVVYLSFVLFNPDLGRMVREGKKNGVKMKPVEIRLLSENDLNIAKQTADLTLDYFRGEDEYKQEKRKEAHRLAARQRREEAAVSKSQPS